MDRRDFLQLAGAAALSSALPSMSWAAAPYNRNARILVLVELKGGNDGFNTLIPFDDDIYYHLRPKLGIRKQALTPLQDGMGMHVALQPLKSVWDAGDMAWIQGVGYPNSILSHFRSMDIWDTGVLRSDSSAGWLSRVVPRFKQGLHGIAVTRDPNSLGPLEGHALNSVSMEDPRSFIAQNKLIEDVPIQRRTAALAHVTTTQHQLAQVGKQIIEKMHGRRIPVQMPAPKGVLGHSLRSVAEMIVNGVDAPVYKVTQDGFDTHVGQSSPHANALYHVGHSLAAFAEAMKRAGLWDNVLVVTYSEFGRRVKENNGQGTDHGTASAHMVMGAGSTGAFSGAIRICADWTTMTMCCTPRTFGPFTAHWRNAGGDNPISGRDINRYPLYKICYIQGFCWVTEGC
ncbi:MAG: DUF1501 domain-containing protein [Thiolinea sp.]